MKRKSFKKENSLKETTLKEKNKVQNEKKKKLRLGEEKLRFKGDKKTQKSLQKE